MPDAHLAENVCNGVVVATTDSDHNYVCQERHFGETLWVHRKGALDAADGNLGIIPGSMGTLSYHVEQNLEIGTQSQLAAVVLQSEDSETLNTSVVGRMNLTLRQSLAYLQPRSPAHARCDRRLDEDLDLVQCHYNFVRTHLALKFRSTCQTPAMQAGLTNRPLSFRDIFDLSVPSRPLATVAPFPVRRLEAESAQPRAPLAA